MTLHPGQRAQKASQTKTQKVCAQWFQGVLEKGTYRIRKDFVTDVRGYVPKASHEAFEQEDNAGKNRYDDIILLDSTRVRLQNNGGDDYIHASWVTITSDYRFICTQGPLAETVPDFWRMILQENCQLIIQLCQNVEGGEPKCEAYFPATPGETAEYSRFSVKMMGKPKKIESRNDLLQTKLQVKNGDQSQQVWHILYTGWPDHFIPEYPTACRVLHEHVKKLSDKKPVVVHCSAGVGRTGTFVALEMMVHKLLEEKDASVSAVEVVTKLRDQRMHAVQNDQQYLFLHRCVLDVIEHNEPEALVKSDVEKFLKDYKDLFDRKKDELKKQQQKRK